MSLSQPLLAQGFDPGDLIGIVVVILFIVIPVIAQWVAKIGRQQQQQQQQQPGGAARPAQQPARRPAEPAVEDEIGEFLRRAARRGGQQAPQPPAAPQPAEQPIQAEAVPDRPLGERMREQVAEHLDAGRFDRRAAELGDEVAQADEHLDERLHHVFDHEVSRLAATPGESAAPPAAVEAQQPEDRVADLPPTAAAGLTALLSTAQSIRQAIVVNELLQRPEHRWT